MNINAISFIVRQRADDCPNTRFNRMLGIIEYKFNWLYAFGGWIRALLYNKQIENNYFNDLKNDVEGMKLFFPSGAKNFLDIGAGIGGIDLLLSKIYPNAHFYLLDKHETSSVTPGFSGSHGFYNNFEVAKKYLLDKGMQSNQLSFVEPKNVNDLPTADVVFSLYSCGFHYPLATYIDIFENSIKSGGVVIVDVRHGTGEREYANALGQVKVVWKNYSGSRIAISK